MEPARLHERSGEVCRTDSTWIGTMRMLWQARRMAITPDELDRLGAACAAATPGPWVHFTEHGEPEPGNEPGTGYWEVITQEADAVVILASELEVDDAEFIVVARAYVPLLIDEVRRLQGEDR
jgi:hypothetical protein